jgi:hypothetical protein
MKRAGFQPFLLVIAVLCSVAATAEVTASSNPALVGQPVIFTVSVDVPVDIAATPTGTVTLIDGDAVIATAPVQNGTASFTTEFAENGDHSITAVYSGDQNFQPVNSPQFLEHVTANDAFTIAVTPSTLSQTSGDASNVTVTLFAGSTTSEPVQLSCENLPPGTACSFQSNAIQPVVDGASTTMTITTAGSHIAASRLNAHPYPWAAALICPLIFGGFVATSPGRTRFRPFLAIAMCTVGIMGLSGCKNTLKVIKGGTPVGLYTINVIGNNSALTQTASVQLRIN